MQAVLKYPLKIVQGIQRVRMPIGSQILSIQLQHGNPTLWALTFGGGEDEDRLIRMTGAGWDMPPAQYRFIDTLQDGEFGWHFFEVMP